MAKVTREELYKKYNKEMLAMNEASGLKDDNDELLGKLIYTYRVKKGIIPAEGADVYPEIPEDFDWEEFGKDYADLMTD